MLPIFETAAGGELVHVAKHAQLGCKEQHRLLTIEAVSPETNNDTQDGFYSYENLKIPLIGLIPYWLSRNPPNVSISADVLGFGLGPQTVCMQLRPACMTLTLG